MGDKMDEFKMFGGKRFKLWQKVYTKPDADKSANWLRANGAYARVTHLKNKNVSTGKEYRIWVR